MIAMSTEESSHEVDILQWLSNATLEYVAQGVMGFSLDALSRDASSVHPMVRATKNLV